MQCFLLGLYNSVCHCTSESSNLVLKDNQKPRELDFVLLDLLIMFIRLSYGKRRLSGPQKQYNYKELSNDTFCSSNLLQDKFC